GAGRRPRTAGGRLDPRPRERVGRLSRPGPVGPGLFPRRPLRVRRRPRHGEFLQRPFAGLVTLPLDPGVGVVQSLRRREEGLLIEARGALPLLIPVLVAPRQGHAVPRPPLAEVPPPDGRLNAAVVGLVVGGAGDLRLAPLLGAGRLRDGWWWGFLFHT